jgi:hypothetical protein
MKNFKIPEATPTADDIDFYSLAGKATYGWVERVCKKEPICVVCRKYGSGLSSVGSIVQPDENCFISRRIKRY